MTDTITHDELPALKEAILARIALEETAGRLMLHVRIDRMQRGYRAQIRFAEVMG
jgi:hypothetical protein